MVILMPETVGVLTKMSVLLNPCLFPKIRVYFPKSVFISVNFRVYFREFPGFVSFVVSLLFGPQYLIKNG